MQAKLKIGEDLYRLPVVQFRFAIMIIIIINIINTKLKPKFFKYTCITFNGNSKKTELTCPQIYIDS